MREKLHEYRATTDKSRDGVPSGWPLTASILDPVFPVTVVSTVCELP